VPRHRRATHAGSRRSYLAPVLLGAATVTLLAPSSVASATPPRPVVSVITDGPAGPLFDGQMVDVQVAPNHMFRPGTRLFIEECQAPTSSHMFSPGLCDRSTVQSGPMVALRHGAAYYADYTVFALPDVAILHHSPNHRPVCDQNHACVLLVGPAGCDRNPVWLAFWSRPFFVDPASPGTGTPEVPFVLVLPVLAMALFGGTVLVRRRRSSRATISTGS
jgi:hypothetical protein